MFLQERGTGDIKILQNSEAHTCRYLQYMVFPVGESGFGLYTGFGIGLNFQPAVSYSINDEKKTEFVIMFFYDPCIATCVAGS